MKILSVGPLPISRNNTTSHRNECLRRFADENFEELDSTLKINLWFRIINKLSYYGLKFNIPDNAHVNRRLIETVKSHHFDIIWIDKGYMIYPETLKLIKELQPNCKLVHYMIDDFMNPYHKTKQIIETIPLYDFYIVNRKANIQELMKYGCKHPIWIYMSYEKNFHKVYKVSEKEALELGGDVGFIGTYERQRGESIKYLADNGIKVRVYGHGWNHLKYYSKNLSIEGEGLYDERFCKAIQSFKINLGFLRKKSRDNHTTRTFEIPACGGFMLAERTSEHLELFNEDKEAAFFSSDEELLKKCRYYLEHEEERRAIAEAGTVRCFTSGYSNEEAVEKLLGEISPELFQNK